MKKAQDIYNEAQVIVDSAKAEERDLTPEEDSRVAELLKEGEAVAKRETMLKELEKRQAEMAESRGRVYKPEAQDLPKDEKRGYSFVRAINCLLQGKPVDGLEGEISKELSKRSGKETAGFFAPMDTRALDSTTGTGAVPTVYSPNLIEMLRNKSVVMQAGATVLPNLAGAGTYTIPKQTGAATAYWISESGDSTASNQTISSISLQPNTLSAMTEISRRFMLSSSIDAEQFVRNDLGNVVALALDYACLYGDGTTQPITGVLRDTNTNVVVAGDGTNGANLTLVDLINMEKEISVDNAEFAGAQFVTGPKLRAWLKSHKQDYDSTVTQAGPVFWGGDNTLIGYPAFASNQVPEALTVGSATCSAIVLGAFSQMLIGFWGQEILVDPYSLSKSGGVRIVSLVDVDMALRNAVAFCRCVDAKNT